MSRNALGLPRKACNRDLTGQACSVLAKPAMLRCFVCNLMEASLTTGAWLCHREFVQWQLGADVETASHLHASSIVVPNAVGHGSDQALVKSDHAHNVSSHPRPRRCARICCMLRKPLRAQEFTSWPSSSSAGRPRADAEPPRSDLHHSGFPLLNVGWCRVL